MWLYQERKIESIQDFPENTYGFIYEVTHLPTGRKYIGKKVLYFNRTLAPLKGEKKKRKVIKESDWMEYYGSHPEIKKILKEEGKQNFTREILILVSSKKLLTYYECKYLFQKGVIEPDSIYINDNILAKFYRKDFLK
jgi:hypothetical protein